MNRQNFIQSGGFPFQTETLDQMQKAYDIFNSLGNIAGNFSIILGCQTVGSQVANGVVFINGELLEFRGGQIGTTVVIIENAIAQEFEDGNDKEVILIRYAAFGIGSVSFAWLNFKRPKTTVELTEDKAEQSLIETLIQRIEDLEDRPVSNVPIDMIAIWGRPFNEIPAGWVEYQPLRGRTPIGLDPNYDGATNGDNTNYNLQTIGVSGGKREHILTRPELPNVNLTRNVGPHTVASGPVTISSNENGAGFLESIPLGGQDKAHTNMSPYRVVFYIQYKGI